MDGVTPYRLEMQAKIGIGDARNLTDSAIRLELIYHPIMNMFLNEIQQNDLDKRCSMRASFV